jgi:hypothetical protein
VAFLKVCADIDKPSNLGKVSVTCKECNIVNGQFVMRFTLSNRLGHVVKLLKIVNTKFNSAFPEYSRAIAILNGRPNREEFNFCADAINKAALSTFVLTSIKLDTARNAKLAAIERKTAAVTGKKSSPASLREPKGQTEYLSVAAKSPMSALLCAYLHDMGCNCVLADDRVIVYAQTTAAAQRMLDRAKDAKNIDAWATALGKQRDPTAIVLNKASFGPVAHMSTLAGKSARALAADIKSAL